MQELIITSVFAERSIVVSDGFVDKILQAMGRVAGQSLGRRTSTVH